MANLLVVDDEPNVLYSLRKVLESEELRVRTARTARQGLEMIERDAPDAVVLDVRLPDMSGLDAFDRIREIDARLPVIVITAYASTDTAIEAMKRGAFEYLLKPVDLRHLRDVVGKAVEMSRLRHVPAVPGGDAGGGDGDPIVGRCPAMQEVYKAVGRVAPQDVTVLILGESGTGKELVARAVYQHSRRGDGPFLAINCAAIPEGLLESELFGHERGAFTGADRQRVGKFEQAHRGTLFLDEIGDMSPATQAKVLRVLQEQKFERVGGAQSLRTDVRLIAATNQNLEQLVTQGRFRADLFYRLNVFTIRLPALRERTGDLPLLVDHFLSRANVSLQKQVRSVAADALEILGRHGWPGNVRELESVIKSAVVQAAGDVLTADALPEALRTGPRPGAVEALPANGELAALVAEMLRGGQTDIYRKAVTHFDKVVLEIVLRHTKGNQVAASELLGISRTTLRAKLHALGLTVEKHLQADGGVG